MNIPTWEELLRPLLVNPVTTIQENTYYALAGGGGVLFKGREYQLFRGAQFNSALIEVIVRRYRLNGWVLDIRSGPVPFEQHFLWAGLPVATEQKTTLRLKSLLRVNFSGHFFEF